MLPVVVVGLEHGVVAICFDDVSWLRRQRTPDAFTTTGAVLSISETYADQAAIDGHKVGER